MTRIETFTKGAQHRGTPALATLMLVLVLTAATLAVACATWASDDLQSTADSSHTEKKRADLKYQKWLSEDVKYIITREERTQFKKLKTDAQRDKFIEEFWQRRSPDPDSTVNAYKQLYYRDLACANQHFAFAGKPGWRTDRGRILLVWGPPDEIDSHPAGKPYPYEEWKYRYLAGIGENAVFVFADRSRNGDLRLIRQPKRPKPFHTGIPE